MQLVSHYPQVPIATSNPATDAARVESQQRPPVIPPQHPSKGHEERAFNPQHERTADSAQQQAKQADRVQERQQQSGQQQQQQEQRQGSKPLRLNLFSKPALDRRDIHNRQLAASAYPNPVVTLNSGPHPMPNETPQFYRELGQRIDTFYHQCTEPMPAAGISALA
ncbi:hypothetical protein [Shewanella chilikensis]|uniref:hypothetical protein n=1 Tax=Shewanella chilikensis TaxID=558541 RepID=UPI001F35438E|nr:hypothetical protein [Shewanella chilikensis]MCE9786794.1 hypothetical protein [Shewanella chilikensis]